MSTVISNAVRFSSGVSLAQALEYLKDLRPIVRKTIYESHVQELLDEAVRVHDSMMLARLGWREEEEFHAKNTLGQASNVLTDRRREDKKEYGREEFPCVATVFTHGRFVYALLSNQNAVFKTIFEHYKTQGVWEDYSYWNNTDRPDDVTAQQWKRREKVWDTVFASSSYPSDVGVTVQLSRTNDYDFDMYEFFAHLRACVAKNEPLSAPGKITAVPHRLSHMANLISHAPWFADVSFDNGFGQFMRRSRELEKGENQEFNSARAFLEAHVVAPVSLDVLFTDIKELNAQWDQTREGLRALDIPVSLQTPTFQNKQLSEIVPAANFSSSKAKI